MIAAAYRDWVSAGSSVSGAAGIATVRLPSAPGAPVLPVDAEHPAASRAAAHTTGTTGRRTSIGYVLFLAPAKKPDKTENCGTVKIAITLVPVWPGVNRSSCYGDVTTRYHVIACLRQVSRAAC